MRDLSINVLELKHDMLKISSTDVCCLAHVASRQALIGCSWRGSLPGRRRCHSSVIRGWRLTRSPGYTACSARCPGPVLAAPSGPTFFQASSGKRHITSRLKLIAKLL